MHHPVEHNMLDNSSSVYEILSGEDNGAADFAGEFCAGLYCTR